MKKKRTLVTFVVLAILCVLVYLQVRTWKSFDWRTFWHSTGNINWGYIINAVVCTYVAYLLRAVRWRIFLKPVRTTTSTRLLGPQFIGFTALALLGRPGEMVRPYLIARKEHLTFSSQMAVWLVERIFDMASVAIMFVIAGFVGDRLWSQLSLSNLQSHVELSAGIFLAGIVVLTVVAIILRRSGDAIANSIERRFQHRNHGLAHSLCSKIRSFTLGLETIAGWSEFFQLLFYSLLMWVLCVFAYWFVTHAYPGRLSELGVASILMLLVASMFGSLIQLPGVGGGAQLATIAVLNHVFGVENELAVSCGMLLWAATFMSVIPAGLFLAHTERISLRQVVEEEERQEEALAE